VQRKPAYWRTRFGEFVSSYTVARLVHDLGAAGAPVTISSVYHWVAGREPRLRTARIIVDLSGGALTLDDVASQRRRIEASACRPSRAARDAGAAS
jgi:hypothetical protein